MNIEKLTAEFEAAKEVHAKAKAKFERKKAAPEQNLRSVADLKRDKLAMIDAEIAMHDSELELIAEKEASEQRSNSVGKCQVELDLAERKVAEGLDELGLTVAAFFLTSSEQATIYRNNSVIQKSLLVKHAKEKLRQAGQIEYTIEQQAKRVASALANAEKEREAFFANERRGI